MLEIAAGHYQQKQLACPSGLIAWSHGARFRTGLSLVGEGGRLLDYGCGDGTFLAMAARRFDSCVGADVDVGQIEDCQTRFAGVDRVSFCPVSELHGGAHVAAYDVVVCMETLEHCVGPTIDRVLGDLARLCSPAGRVVISVPIETGATFALKYAGRKLAAWRGLSDYRHYERYAVSDALRMFFATEGTSFDRPVYGEPGAEFHSHYGFNWRAMRRQVRQHLKVERTVFSPLGLLGSWANSQAWFLCRPLNRTAQPS